MQVVNKKSRCSASRYMCDDCCAIPWILGLTEASVDYKNAHAERTLALSPCPVCRLLGVYLSYGRTGPNGGLYSQSERRNQSVIHFAPNVIEGTDLHSRAYKNMAIQKGPKIIGRNPYPLPATFGPSPCGAMDRQVSN